MSVVGNETLFIDALILFFLTLFLVKLIKKYATSFGLVDVPNERSSHDTPTPRGAGVAIYISFVAIIVLFHLDFFIQYSSFFLSLSIVFLLGLYDDIRDSRARTKLIVIAIATSIAFVFGGFEIKTLGNWFGYDLVLPYALSLIFTIFAVAGFTNALNLIDGLDGLAGTISFIILASLFYIGIVYNDQFIIIVSFFTLISLLAFLVFNWFPASVFMGDSGSLSLGFIIAMLSIKATEYVSDTTILFLAAVPIIDTIIVMTRRIQRKISPFAPDKSHMHHKIMDVKKSVDGTVHIMVALQIILSSLGLLLRDKSDVKNIILFIIILFVFFQVFDSRKEQREMLFISKLKRFYIDHIKSYVDDRVIYAIGGMLVILLIIKLFF